MSASNPSGHMMTGDRRLSSAAQNPSLPPLGTTASFNPRSTPLLRQLTAPTSLRPTSKQLTTLHRDRALHERPSVRQFAYTLHPYYYIGSNR
jgi:hypothetical protein